ncbi:DUF5722 domain-containing protein [Tichowtungia aerotolerans]|uniref:DUF5722 domain-containing protein n=1 Tax=Tichowtungia aerotolerans TaxID=2697043 RepID=A0A6P1M7Q4_9BACT|nr:DUF5722 domain-containing protein [Tichowtungia aerotolerans]QHI70072.1 hypothetical protein GT409_11660 [Tichowtungia aerotolerans]
MRIFSVNVFVFLILVFSGILPVFGAGMTLIKTSDSDITIQLDESVSGSIKLLEIEPYDTLNPLRGLVQNRADCQQLDLSNDGFLRMTFLNGSPFDPQIYFPDYPINADYVGQFSMRVRVSGTQGGADMPFRIFGLPLTADYQDFNVPADGEWHIVRADVMNWSGTRSLRIDPANAQDYAINSNAVVDIDWVAVTYRNDFSGDRHHTGLDVFIDLGMPEPSWSGSAQPEIVLPRYNGVRDRLYSKYILTDGATNQVGSARYVTDLSGLSYRQDSLQNWSSLNTANGVTAAAVSNGILSVHYQLPAGTWDPGVQESGARRIDMDVAQEFAMKYRISGYTGGLSTVSLGVFGFVLGEDGPARQGDVLIPDGEWHVFRTTLDSSIGTLTWHGDVRIRVDVPNAGTAGSQASDFAGGTFELDWLAVSDDALFTPSRPLCEGGQVWTFEDDRTYSLSDGGGFKGTDGSVLTDKTDLGIQKNKMNFLQKNALNLSLSPSTTWAVDEFDVGINANYVHNNLGEDIRYVTANGMATIITSLNSLGDYWLDEGTADQRFNPLRNPLSSPSSPNSFSVAHNVMDPVGLAYYRGTMEYLGRYFSDPSGVNGELYRFTVGNELDQHWSWYNVGEMEMEEVVEIYLVSCRIADLALRSQHPDYRIYLSFTHYWDMLGGNVGALKACNMRDFLDLFAARAKEEGDFPWALCLHPYPQSLLDPTFWDDPGPVDSFDTEYVTFKNLQVARRYLQQESMLYNGQVRGINLGEQGFHVAVDGDAEDEAIQAAAMAYSHKIVEQIPNMEAYLYHRQVDLSLEGNLRFGLWADNPDIDGAQLFRRRPSWYVLRDYGTTNEAVQFDPYLSYLPLSSWDEINLADIALRYEFNAPDPDFTSEQIDAFQITDGVCRGTVSGLDPKIQNLNVNTYGDGQETCILRIKTAKSGSWQLFWRKAGGTFNQTQPISFSVTASGEFSVYQFDLSADTNWCGANITGWRLDPVGSSTAYDFEIDYMYFGPAGDFDGDGIADALESTADSDGDGLPDFADTDSNNNGWSDAREVSNGWNPVSSDTDGDGLSNEWEIQYGFDPHDALESAWDLDADGYDTLAEHIALTDPVDGQDYFVIDGAAGPAVSVVAKAGRTYTLLACTNLSSNVWKAVDVQAVAIDGLLVLVDTNDTETAMYRVRVSK